MGFAEEVAQSKSTPAPKEAPPAAAEGVEQFNLAPGSAPIVPPETPKAPPTIRIGDKEFSDQSEAFNYAREMAAKMAGMNEVIEKIGKPAPEAPKEAPAPVKDLFEELEEEFYVNPKEAFKKMYAKAVEDSKKQVFEQYDKMTSEQQAQAQREQGWKSFWKSTYEANPDLAEFQEVVEQVVLNKVWNEVKDIPLEKAQERIVAEARRMLKLQKEASAKQTELPSGPAFVASTTSGPAVVATPKETESSLDFVSQLKKTRKGKS